MEPFFHAETQKKAETKYDQIFLFSAEKAKKIGNKKNRFRKKFRGKTFLFFKSGREPKKKKSLNKQTN